MQNLSEFLEKFKKFTPPDDTIRTEFVRLVKEIADFDLAKEDVTLKNGTLNIVAHDSATKSHLFMYKKPLLAAMKETFKAKAPTDIR